MTTLQNKTVALFASKLGYQTRNFEAAAQKLAVRLAYVTDRCHELSDPWGDHAIAARFANPEEAAATAMQSLRGTSLDAILAVGDTPALAAAYAARGLGLRGNHPAAEETETQQDEATSAEGHQLGRARRLGSEVRTKGEPGA